MEGDDLIEFTAIVNRLSALYPKLMNYAAVTAVNFFKERFVLGQDVNGVPFKPRSKNVWGKQRRRDTPTPKGAKSGRGGRATLVDTGRLKRDVQKLFVGADYAIIGTTRLTAPYAKANNEGFSGTVKQHVRAHDRKRYGKEKRGTGVYSVKTQKERTKTVTIVTGTVRVKAYDRTINQKIPKRQFMGNSALLDKRIERVLTAEMIRAIKG